MLLTLDVGVQLRECIRLLLAFGLCPSLAGCGSPSSTDVSNNKAETSSDGGGGIGGGTTDGGGSHGDATTGASSGGSGGVAGNVSDTTTGGTATGSSGGAGGSTTGTMTGTSGGESPACPGFEQRPDVPGTTCRSPDDCVGGATCDSFPVSGCGFCVSPQRACEEDDDCSAGGHCVEFESTETCVCTNDRATECRPACTATSCGDEQECVDEVCRPRSCEDGYACGSGFVCAPDRGTSDAHGCAPTNCNEGRACAPGYTCDTLAGSCLAVHCSQGGAAVCPENMECETETSGRGCVPKACDVDADCDCGVCIHGCTGDACPRGQCAGHLYVCNLPVP